MKKQTILLSIFLLVSSLFLSACGGGEKGSYGHKKEVKSQGGDY